MPDRALPEILELPPVPQEVKEAVNAGRLVVFVGAGVSRLAGCRGWGDLANDLLDVCQRKAGLDFRERESIARSGDHKKVITICHHLLKDRGVEDAFHSTLRQALTPDPGVPKSGIYDDVIKLRGLFLTTNADTLFDPKFVPSRVYWEVSDLTKERITSNALFHIHGHIDHEHTLVFTAAQYLWRYRDPGFRLFLEHLFTNYTILFLGYGLSEFEVLGAMLPEEVNIQMTFGRYLLEPYYSTDSSLLGYDQSYYDDFGIKVVPYLKDKSGYHQLAQVLKYWNSEINSTTTFLNRALSRIDREMDRAEPEGVQDVLQLLKDNPEVQEYFFQKLAKASYPLRWFTHLVDEGYFEPSRNPRPVESPDRKGFYSIPHWYAVEALANVVAKCAEAGNQEPFDLAKEVLDKLIAAEDVAKPPIHNFRTSWLLLKAICQLPPELIDLSYIAFVDQAVTKGSGWSLIDAEIGDAFLPRVLDGGNPNCILALLKVVLGFKAPSSMPSRELQPRLNPPAFVDCLQKNRPAILRWGLTNVISLVKTFIQEASAVDPYAFSAIYVPTIEAHPQTISPERYGCQLTYMLRDAILALNSEDGGEQIQTLLQAKEPILRRVAYYAMGERFGDWGIFFWSLPHNPLEETERHEVYELLKKNCRLFNPTQLKQCVDWIGALRFDFAGENDVDEAVRLKYEAYKKREWLSALGDSADPSVTRLSERYLAVNEAPIEHPGFSSWVGGAQWVSEVSPITEEEFKAMSPRDAVAYLNAFTQAPRQFSKNFTEVSLTGALRRFVASDPEHFLADLSPYLEAETKYQNELMRGFEEATRTKNLSNWPAVVDFALALVKQVSDSLKGAPPDDRDLRTWLVGAIADLLSTATNQDRVGFPESCVDAAERLVVALMNLPSMPFQPTNDILTSVLNCQSGRVALCAVNISVAITKKTREGSAQPWLGPVQKEITKRLDATDGDFAELRATLAFNLNNLFYLDATWAKQQFPRIFDLKRSDTWVTAFSSYLLSTGVVYQDVYELLREGGHFDKAIDMDFLGRDVDQKFVQVVVVGFMAGWDDLGAEGGILHRLISKGNTEQLGEVGRFIWSQKQLAEGAFRDKVLPLWHVLIERASQGPEPQIYGEALSEMASWLMWADTIDVEVFGLMERTIQYMDTSRFPPFFVEELAKRVEVQPQEVGKLFWAFLEPRSVPYYKQDVIQGLVDALFRHKEHESAMRISTYYARHGFHFLREIVDKYGSSPPSLLSE